MILMTLQELFILNDILDSQNICYLPSFLSLKMTEEIYSAAKDSLIEKGLLKNYDRLTEQGALITKRLKEYKEAKKYVQVMSLSYGIVDDDKAILISQLKEGDYDIKLTDISNAANQFLDAFTFLKNAPNSKADTIISIDEEKLKKEYRFNQHFRLKTKVENNKTDELYFISNSQLYIYDHYKQTLSAMSCGDIVNLFKERLKNEFKCTGSN